MNARLLPAAWCAAIWLGISWPTWGQTASTVTPPPPSTPLAAAPMEGESPTDLSGVKPVSFDGPAIVEPMPSPPTVAETQAIQAPPATPVSYPQPTMAPGCCDSCGGACCGACLHPLEERHSFWFGGIDLGFAQPTFANNRFTISDRSAGFAARPYLGWQNERGMGIRARLWMYGDTAPTLETPSGIHRSVELGAASLDIDFYKEARIEDARIRFGVGVKSAGVQFEHPGLGEDNISAGGMSGFIEGGVPIWYTDRSRWSIVGMGRMSLLAGTAEWDAYPAPFAEADANLTIGELGFGLEYMRRLARSDFVFQFMSETQMWENTALGDLSFDGAMFRAGMQW